jgi:hypothetical protein
MLRFTTLAALTFAAASPALAAPLTQIGEGDGERFEYSSELRADGTIHIDGVLLSSREHFRLDVARNGRVNGRFGMWPVSYRVTKETRDSLAAKLGEGTSVADASTH